MIAALVFHGLLLCLLWTARSPAVQATADVTPLTVWDVTPPPPPEPPPPPPPRETPLPEAPALTPPGGSESRRSPIRAPVPKPALAMPRVAIELMPALRPLQPAALPGPSGAAGMGSGGDGDTGRGNGEGGGDGAGRGVSIVGARWYRKPGPRELDPHVPWKLRQQPIKAVVYLNCRVSLNKRVHNCKVVREIPAGSGFGAAALAATRSFRVWPATVDGKPVDNAGVIVPVEYNYE